MHPAFQSLRNKRQEPKSADHNNIDNLLLGLDGLRLQKYRNCTVMSPISCQHSAELPDWN
ncbi:hypothetical protein J6590_073639 [Homalodisca vitripennis]|nr:hypothetical protein J6590_073639 [Homalodisca vitripennis]